MAVASRLVACAPSHERSVIFPHITRLVEYLGAVAKSSLRVTGNDQRTDAVWAGLVHGVPRGHHVPRGGPCLGGEAAGRPHGLLWRPGHAESAAAHAAGAVWHDHHAGTELRLLRR